MELVGPSADIPAGANISNSTDSPHRHLWVPLSDGMVALVVILSLLTLLTAFLNSAVILAVCSTKKLRLPANYLICSLALTDLMVAVLVMPISILYIAMETWTLGQVLCSVWLCIDMTCCTCSILHLCVIALDRFWAITKAIEYAHKRTRRRAALMVAAVWIISVIISLPPLFWRRWPDSNAIQHCFIEHDYLGYTIFSTLGAFYIPMIILLILYYRIYSAAKLLYQKRGSSRHTSSRSMGSQNSMDHGRISQTFCIYNSDPISGTEEHSTMGHTEVQDEKNQICTSREKKAARILGLILGAFLVCWLPFFFKELLVGMTSLQPSPLVSDLLTWLGYINSLVNPLLYTSFNDDFKIALKKLLKRKEHVQM